MNIDQMKQVVKHIWVSYYSNFQIELLDETFEDPVAMAEILTVADSSNRNLLINLVDGICHNCCDSDLVGIGNYQIVMWLLSCLGDNREVLKTVLMFLAECDNALSILAYIAQFDSANFHILMSQFNHQEQLELVNAKSIHSNADILNQMLTNKWAVGVRLFVNAGADVNFTYTDPSLDDDDDDDRSSESLYLACIQCASVITDIYPRFVDANIYHDIIGDVTIPKIQRVIEKFATILTQDQVIKLNTLKQSLINLIAPLDPLEDALYTPNHLNGYTISDAICEYNL